jgi:hypothetical protein
MGCWISTNVVSVFPFSHINHILVLSILHELGTLILDKILTVLYWASVGIEPKVDFFLV